MNITLQTWDRGDPVRSTSVTVPLDILLHDNEAYSEQTVKLEIDEGLPEGTSCLPLVWKYVVSMDKIELNI